MSPPWLGTKQWKSLEEPAASCGWCAAPPASGGASYTRPSRPVAVSLLVSHTLSHCPVMVAGCMFSFCSNCGYEAGGRGGTGGTVLDRRSWFHGRPSVCLSEAGPSRYCLASSSLPGILGPRAPTATCCSSCSPCTPRCSWWPKLAGLCEIVRQAEKGGRPGRYQSSRVKCAGMLELEKA